MNKTTIFPYNEKIEQQIKEIRKLVRLSMNGVISESMSSLGYKLNWGVAIPRIKELAARFDKNAQLAMQLWNIGHRETMIMATLLMPENECPESVAIRWAEEAINSEIAEQCCRNLFAKLPYADKLAEQSYNNTAAPLSKDIAYRLASKIIQNGLCDRSPFSAKLISFVMSDAQNKTLSDPIAQYLKQYAKHTNKTKAENTLNDLKEANPWVFEEVSTFIKYW